MDITFKSLETITVVQNKILLSPLLSTAGIVLRLSTQNAKKNNNKNKKLLTLNSLARNVNIFSKFTLKV